jgi:hypothetical protein
MVYLSYPELTDLENRDFTAEHWQRLLDRLSENSARWQGSDSKQADRVSLMARAMKGYPAAKQFLVDAGHPADEIEAMPVAQVVALYTVRTYDEFRDELFKWMLLPYWQAKTGIERSQRALHEGRSREIVPLASLIIPAVASISQASARSERTIAMLRTIEALRIYGAAHDGQLPASLADVTDVPMPVDPFTGTSFVYRREGDAAVLESSLHQGSAPRHDGVKFEIKFVQ